MLTTCTEFSCWSRLPYLKLFVLQDPIFFGVSSEKLELCKSWALVTVSNQTYCKQYWSQSYSAWKQYWPIIFWSASLIKSSEYNRFIQKWFLIFYVIHLKSFKLRNGHRNLVLDLDEVQPQMHKDGEETKSN